MGSGTIPVDETQCKTCLLYTDRVTGSGVYEKYCGFSGDFLFNISHGGLPCTTKVVSEDDDE